MIYLGWSLVAVGVALMLVAVVGAWVKAVQVVIEDNFEENE